jgi:hypothetical protein
MTGLQIDVLSATTGTCFIVIRNLGTWHVSCDLMSNNIAINWAYDFNNSDLCS